MPWSDTFLPVLCSCGHAPAMALVLILPFDCQVLAYPGIALLVASCYPHPDASLDARPDRHSLAPAAGVAILTGRLPPAALPLSLVSSPWRAFGLAAHTQEPCRNDALRHCRRASPRAGAWRCSLPHVGPPPSVAILTALMKPSPGRSITGFRCETASRYVAGAPISPKPFRSHPPIDRRPKAPGLAGFFGRAVRPQGWGRKLK